MNTNQAKSQAIATAEPVAQAIDALKSILDLQDRGNGGGSDIQTILSGISAAVSYLENLEERSTTAASRTTDVNAAMNRLREVLSALQSTPSESSEFDEAARTVARTLAVLYPLSKIGESRVPLHPIASREPVPPHIIERRTATRTPVEAEVGFQSDTNFFMGFSEDISTGGLFIATFDLRPLGSVMNLNFTLPGGHLISVDGVVRWVREYNETTPEITPGMGIQFENLRRDDKEAIEEFINERPALFYDDE